MGDDCYYYYYSSCAKGAACPFRHAPEALGSEVMCALWVKGRCNNQSCSFRHMQIQKDRSTIMCYWESQPGGCRKSHCPFRHASRPTNPVGATAASGSAVTMVTSSADASQQEVATSELTTDISVAGQQQVVQAPKAAPVIVNPNDDESDIDSINNSPQKKQSDVITAATNPSAAAMLALQQQQLQLQKLQKEQEKLKQQQQALLAKRARAAAASKTSSEAKTDNKATKNNGTSSEQQDKPTVEEEAKPNTDVRIAQKTTKTIVKQPAEPEIKLDIKTLDDLNMESLLNAKKQLEEVEEFLKETEEKFEDDDSEERRSASSDVKHPEPDSDIDSDDSQRRNVRSDNQTLASNTQTQSSRRVVLSSNTGGVHGRLYHEDCRRTSHSPSPVPKRDYYHRKGARSSIDRSRSTSPARYSRHRSSISPDHYRSRRSRSPNRYGHRRSRSPIGYNRRSPGANYRRGSPTPPPASRSIKDRLGISSSTHQRRRDASPPRQTERLPIHKRIGLATSARNTTDADRTRGLTTTCHVDQHRPRSDSEDVDSDTSSDDSHVGSVHIKSLEEIMREKALATMMRAREKKEREEKEKLEKEAANDEAPQPTKKIIRLTTSSSSSGTRERNVLSRLGIITRKRTASPSNLGEKSDNIHSDRDDEAASEISEESEPEEPPVRRRVAIKQTVKMVFKDEPEKAETSAADKLGISEEDESTTATEAKRVKLSTSPLQREIKRGKKHRAHGEASYGSGTEEQAENAAEERDEEESPVVDVVVRSKKPKKKKKDRGESRWARALKEKKREKRAIRRIKVVAAAGGSSSKENSKERHSKGSVADGRDDSQDSGHSDGAEQDSEDEMKRLRKRLMKAEQEKQLRKERQEKREKRGAPRELQRYVPPSRKAATVQEDSSLGRKPTADAPLKRSSDNREPISYDDLITNCTTKPIKARLGLANNPQPSNSNAADNNTTRQTSGDATTQRRRLGCATASAARKRPLTSTVASKPSSSKSSDWGNMTFAQVMQQKRQRIREARGAGSDGADQPPTSMHADASMHESDADLSLSIADKSITSASSAPSVSSTSMADVPITPISIRSNPISTTSARDADKNTAMIASTTRKSSSGSVPKTPTTPGVSAADRSLSLEAELDAFLGDDADITLGSEDDDPLADGDDLLLEVEELLS